MGYRSDVQGVIYGDEDKVTSLLVSAKLSGDEHTDYILQYIREVTIPLPHLDPAYHGLHLSWASVKWYDDYPEIQAWYRLRDKALEMGLCYEFVRIGEELDDTEVVEAGEDPLGILSVSRSIDVTYDLQPAGAKEIDNG